MTTAMFEKLSPTITKMSDQELIDALELALQSKSCSAYLVAALVGEVAFRNLLEKTQSE